MHRNLARFRPNQTSWVDYSSPQTPRIRYKVMTTKKVYEGKGVGKEGWVEEKEWRRERKGEGNSA